MGRKRPQRAGRPAGVLRGPRTPLPHTRESETGNTESLSGAPRKVKLFIPYGQHRGDLWVQGQEMPFPTEPRVSFSRYIPFPCVPTGVSKVFTP